MVCISGEPKTTQICFSKYCRFGDSWVQAKHEAGHQAKPSCREIIWDFVFCMVWIYIWFLFGGLPNLTFEKCCLGLNTTEDDGKRSENVVNQPENMTNVAD